MVSPRLLTALCAGVCHAQVPNPVDPAALTPLYEQALQEREQLYGERSAQVAQAALDLGLQLKATGDLSGAERMLRRALDLSNSPESAEGLAGVLEEQGRAGESLKLYLRAAEGPSDEAAARTLASAVSSVKGGRMEIAIKVPPSPFLRGRDAFTAWGVLARRIDCPGRRLQAVTEQH